MFTLREGNLQQRSGILGRRELGHARCPDVSTLPKGRRGDARLQVLPRLLQLGVAEARRAEAAGHDEPRLSRLGPAGQRV